MQLAAAGAYSGHPLRRGFANWAASDGWDVKSRMEYVGWRHINSALRYLDASVSFAKDRMEHGMVRRVDELDRRNLSVFAPTTSLFEEVIHATR
jgi:hypothetical protein